MDEAIAEAGFNLFLGGYLEGYSFTAQEATSQRPLLLPIVMSLSLRIVDLDELLKTPTVPNLEAPAPKTSVIFPNSDVCDTYGTLITNARALTEPVPIYGTENVPAPDALLDLLGA